MTKDEALKLALEALEYHTAQTRPIHQTSEAITTIKEALAQPGQEPVAYLSYKRQRLNIELKPQTFVEIPTATNWEMPLYMKPPQRTWVELTDEEIEELANEYLFAEEDLEMLFVGGSVEFARALLKKAKEK